MASTYCIKLFIALSLLVAQSSFALKVFNFAGNNFTEKFKQNIDLVTLALGNSSSDSKEFLWDHGNVDFELEKIRCLRYCLENVTASENEDQQTLTLIWMFGDQNLTDPEKILVSTVLTEESKNDKLSSSKNKCENFMVLGCQVPLTADLSSEMSNSSNKTQNLLIPTEEANGTTERKLTIKSNIQAVYINVLGDISEFNLELPIKWSAATRTLDAALFASRMRKGMEVNLNVHNPPEGEWKVKISGVENSKYRFKVTTFMHEKLKEVDGTDKKVEEKTQDTTFTASDEIKGNPRMKRILTDDVELTKSLEDIHNTAKTRQNYESENIDSELNESEEKPGIMRESELVESFDNENVSLRLNLDTSARNQPLEIDEFQSNEGYPRKKYVLIDVTSTTHLTIEPKTYKTIDFEITNNYPFNILVLLFAASSQFVIFPFVGNRNSGIIRPGQKMPVKLSIETRDPNIENGELTLQVYSENPVHISIVKTVHISVVRNSATRWSDDEKPTLNFYFNNNCNGLLNSAYCAKNWWSVDIEAQDLQSGLKVVTSSPSGIYPLSDYTSGTKSLQRFYYTATCCNPEVVVEAVDVLENRHTRTIDVRAWYNLSIGEIAAIVVGILAIIMLIALITIAVIYCIKKKDSVDLPFSQRYGSRTARRSEGTNF